MAKFFVWVEGFSGPSPQIWHDRLTDVNGKDQSHLVKHKLADDDRRSVDDLIRSFPYGLQ